MSVATRRQRWGELAAIVSVLGGPAIVPAVVPAVASAAPSPTRITVLAPASPPPLIADAALRLAGELRSGGLDAVLAQGKPGGDPCEVSEDPGGVAPLATISIGSAREGAAVDVWVCDRMTDKTVMRHMAGGEDAGALAIRGAELLRASLIEVAIEPRAALPDDVARWLGPLPAVSPQEAPAPPHPLSRPAEASSPLSAPSQWDDPWRDAPAPPPPKPAPPTRTSRAVAGVGVGLLASLGGFPAAVGPELEARYRTAVGVELAARATAAFAPKDLKDSQGQATLSTTLRHGLGTATVLYRFGDEAAPLRPAVGSGLGVYVLDVDGNGDATHPGNRTVAASFVPTLEAGVEMAFHARVHGELDVATLFPVPDPVVVISGAPAGRAGEPLVLATLGVSISL